MEYRAMDVTLISADNLKDVNLMTKMSVYVTVSVSGDPRTLRRTQVDKDCGKSPRWGQRVSLPVADNLRIVFKLFSERMFGDREIGEVSVLVKELLEGGGNGGDGGERVVEYQVRTLSGKNKGTLKFSYKFGDKLPHAPASTTAAPSHYAAAPPPDTAPPHYANAPHYAATPGPYAEPPPYATKPPPNTGAQPPYAEPTPYAAAPDGKSSSEPVMAYPAQHAQPSYNQQGYGYPPPQQGYGYPPPQQGYGYPPPQQGYGYAPPQQGYGYAPPQQGYGYGAKPPKKKKQGMGGGLGLGLGAGLLGGLLVGDMISDAGDYGGGFDDGGGFDF